MNRLEHLKEILIVLSEINKRFPILVEGKRDVRSLRTLGMEGEILSVNVGKGIYELCEDIRKRYKKIVVLMDWDTRGDELQSNITSNLKGHYEEFAPLRDALKAITSKETKEVEGLLRLFKKWQEEDEQGIFPIMERLR